MFFTHCPSDIIRPIDTFGTRLIRQVFRSDLGGNIRFDFDTCQGRANDKNPRSCIKVRVNARLDRRIISAGPYS
jgi:hypothetical protein